MRKLKLVKPSSLESLAYEYLSLKDLVERYTLQLGQVRTQLEPALLDAPGRRITVENREVVLDIRESRSCDLEAAKRKLGKALVPYIEIVEKLDLKAAEKHLNLEKFVTVKEIYAIRTPKRDEK